jgi:hypothetical protein
MTGYEMIGGQNDRDEMTGDEMKGDEFESSRSPAKFAKRFESSNPDSRIRLTTRRVRKKVNRVNSRPFSKKTRFFTSQTRVFIKVEKNMFFG